MDGFAYTYNRQKTLGGIAFRGLNDRYTPDTGVVNPQVETLGIFGGEVRTDRQIVNKQGDVARANAIAAKVKKAGLFFDRYVVKGDPTADPLQFYGLNARLTGGQVISAGTNGGPLTLDLLDHALDAVVGSNTKKLIVCNKYVRRQITALLRQTAGGARIERDRPAGYGIRRGGRRGAGRGRRRAADSEPGPRRRGRAATTSLYVIRPGSDVDGEYVQGLIGSNLIEHVTVGLLGTFYSDIVEANMGIAMFHPRAAIRVKGIL